MQPPPCVIPGQPMNACARSVYAFEVNGEAHLHGPWHGWRLAGNQLISPDRDRITPESLRGLLYLADLRKRTGLQGDGSSNIRALPAMP